MRFRSVFLVLCSIGSSVFLHAESSNRPENVLVIDQVGIEMQKCRSTIAQHSTDNDIVLKIFDQMANKWLYYQKEHPSFLMQKLLDAAVFSSQKHQGQYRKDPAQTPYISHPLGVAYILWEEGEIRDENILIAALLHDTLEDTDATKEEITHLFGERVCNIVLQVTNDPNLSSEENKQRQVDHAPNMTQEAKLVKLADRLYNIRDLIFAPIGWSEEKINSYYDWGQKLLEALHPTHEILEKALEKELKNHSSSIENS